MSKSIPSEEKIETIFACVADGGDLEAIWAERFLKLTQTEQHRFLSKIMLLGSGQKKKPEPLDGQKLSEFLAFFCQKINSTHPNLFIGALETACEKNNALVLDNCLAQHPHAFLVSRGLRVAAGEGHYKLAERLFGAAMAGCEKLISKDDLIRMHDEEFFKNVVQSITTALHNGGSGAVAFLNHAENNAPFVFDEALAIAIETALSPRTRAWTEQSVRVFCQILKDCGKQDVFFDALFQKTKKTAGILKVDPHFETRRGGAAPRSGHWATGVYPVHFFDPYHDFLSEKIVNEWGLDSLMADFFSYFDLYKPLLEKAKIQEAVGGAQTTGGERAMGRNKKM